MKKIALIIALLVANFFVYSPTTAQTPGTWTATGSMSTPRYEPTATLLNNGKVLVAGGVNGSTSVASAELYDPSTGTWTPTGSMNTARGWHTAILLTNGKVLVAGGQNSNTAAISSAELYDPSTGRWTPTGSMNVGRHEHNAVLLSNGMVLLTGGLDLNYVSQKTAELYDPSTGLWVNTGSMLIGRYWDAPDPPVTLPDGSILIVGGWGCCPYTTINEAEIYNTTSQTWSATSSKKTTANYEPVLLNNGKVLVAGGGKGTQPTTLDVETSELFDPFSGTWIATGSMSTIRNFHTLTLLEDGHVLAAGGTSGGWGVCNNPNPSAELYDPGTGKWATTGSMITVRHQHTATILPNGQVLVVGGVNCSYTSLSSAELYTPPSGCPAPSNLRVPKISDSCARLNWSVPGASVEHIKISYRPVGSSLWKVEQKKGGENAVFICGLTPNTTYEWEVKNICANGATEWVKGPSFTTRSSVAFSSNTEAVNGNNIQGNVSVQITPNPNRGSFTLQMQLPAKASVTTLILYNSLGQKIWQQDAGKLSGSISKNVALENKLSAGVYVMMIQHGDTMLIQKVVVTI